MKNRSIVLAVALIAALFLVPGQLAAQDGGKGDSPGHADAAAMTDEMAAWMELAAPSKEHEFLQKLEGKWNATTTLWMQPGAPPTSGTGFAQNEMILGGRFLQSSYEGQLFDSPFHGLAFDGYDRLNKKYVSTWMDNHGTMMMNFEGGVEGDVRTLVSEFNAPGGKKRMKWVTTIISNKEHKTVGYESTDGAEYRKHIEIVYTRQ